MGRLVKVQRDWNDAIGDLQVRVGVALIPAITDVLSASPRSSTRTATRSSASSQGLVKGAQELGGAIAGLAPIAKGIADAWNSIPPDFRKLLLGGLVANKVLKMTIGFDPIDIGRKILTDTLKSAIGIKAAVVNVTGAIVNGPGGGRNRHPRREGRHRGHDQEVHQGLRDRTRRGG